MSKHTWDSLAESGHSPKMIEAMLDEQAELEQKPKYIYKVTEQSVDVRNFTIETDKPLQDDCGDDIGEVICMVSITKEGDTETGTTDYGVNYKVTYVDTDYGDDAQLDWEKSEEEDNE
jgi:hypothetical protein